MGRHVDRKFICSLAHQYYHSRQRHHKFCFCDSWAIPSGFYGKLFIRSGILKEHSVIVEACVIDSDYRGEVLLFNHHRCWLLQEKTNWNNQEYNVVVELLNVTKKTSILFISSFLSLISARKS